MKLAYNQNQDITFKSRSLAAFLDHRVQLNKAVLDLSIDVPLVALANNSTERKEKLRRVSIGWTLAFLTPLITLPVTNRLALKYIAKLVKSPISKENRLIRLSNKYLVNSNETQKGIESLSKKYKTDFSEVIKNANGNYEKIRQKLINAKMSVLSFDYLFTASSLGCIGFLNNRITKKKTRQDGFSAEFKMADKDIIEKRAEKYKKTEPARKAAFISVLALLTASPLLVKKGLSTNAKNKFADYIKKHASNFDYNDGLFMKRLPFFFVGIASYLGMTMASRNQTELKDNILRNSAYMGAYFGGDILIGSILANISDKLRKTNLLKDDYNKTLFNRIFPPTKPLKELSGKSKKTGSVLFWVNMVALGALAGFGVPYMINKMIKSDVSKDLKLKYTNKDFFEVNRKDAFKSFKLS